MRHSTGEGISACISNSKEQLSVSFGWDLVTPTQTVGSSPRRLWQRYAPLSRLYICYASEHNYLHVFYQPACFCVCTALHVMQMVQSDVVGRSAASWSARAMRALSPAYIVGRLEGCLHPCGAL